MNTTPWTEQFKKIIGCSMFLLSTVLTTSLQATTTLDTIPPTSSIQMNNCGENPVSWFRNYGGTNSDVPHSINQTSDGGFIIAGHTLSDDIDVGGNNGGVDAWVVKIDGDGNMEWEETYGGSATDNGKNIHQTTDGGYILCSEGFSNNGDVGGTAGSFDFWVLKLDNIGNIEWNGLYGGSGGDNAQWLEPTPDGGYVIAGTTNSSDGDINNNQGASDVLVVKIDSNGNLQWTKTIGGSLIDGADYIQVTNDGGYIVAGYTESNNGDIANNNGFIDAFIVKLDNAGTIEWTTTLGGSGQDCAKSIKQSLDGGFIATGTTASSNGDFADSNGDNDGWICKLDPNGVKEWTRTYGSSNTDESKIIVCAPNGDYIVGGKTFNPDVNKGLGDAWVMRLDPLGNIITNLNYGGTMYDYVEDLSLTADGGIVMCGFTESNNLDIPGNNGQADFWVARFESPISLPPAIELGDNTTICMNTSLQLDASPSNCSDCTYAWNAPISGASPMVNPSTSTLYSVTVSTTDGCTSTDEIQVNVSTLDLQVIEESDPAPCQVQDGRIEVAATGGQNNYTYTWATLGTGAVHENLSGGTYAVTLSDNECSITQSINLSNSQGTYPVVDLGANQSACEGQTVALDAGNPGNTYTWSANVGASSQMIDATSTGTYAVTVTTAEGCSTSDDIEITINDGLLVDLGAPIVSCGEAVVLDANLTNMNYSWSTTENDQSITVTTSDTYSVTVTSNAGCTGTANVDVAIYENPSVELGADQSSCVEVTLEGGAGYANYSWSNGSNNSETIANQTDWYMLTVSNSDGCTATDSVYIDILQSVDIDLGQDEFSCEPIALSSNVAGLNYNWSTGENSENILATATDWYVLTASNDDGCSDVDSILITIGESVEVDLGADISQCESVELVAGGSDLSYQWSNGAGNVSNIEATTSGFYAVTATNSSNCLDTDTVYVQILNNLEVDLGNDMEACEVATLDAGISNLDYTWVNQTTNQNMNTASSVLEVSSTGVYSVTVTDGNACTTTDAIYVEIHENPTVNLGDTNEPIQACQQTELTTGNMDVDHIWMPNGETDMGVTVTTSGMVAVTITDENNCSASDSVEVVIIDNLTIDNISNHPSCFGANNGNLVAYPTNGIAPYTYLWDNGETSSNRINLTAGDYTVVISDNDGCSNEQTITLNQPAETINNPVVTPVGCDGTPGHIDMTTSGGDGPPYIFSWDTGDITEDISPMEAGLRIVHITDTIGCVKIDTIEVGQISAVAIEVLSEQNINCFGGNDGSIDVEVEGGTIPYAYAWEKVENNESIPVNEASLTNITSGTYALVVTDIDGCESTKTITLNQPVELAANITVNDGCGGPNGYLSVDALGGTSPYMYEWSNGDTTEESDSLAVGTYELTIEDSHACTTVQSVFVDNHVDVEFDVEASSISCFDEEDGMIEVIPTEGTAPFSFEWSHGDTTAILTDLDKNEYTVFVKDANDCTTTETVSIEEPLVLSASFNSTGNDTASGNIEVTSLGGVAPYDYEWNTGATTNILKNVPGGNYSVTITDANGCLYTESIEFDPSVGVGDLTNLQVFEVYPNPSAGNFYIKTIMDDYKDTFVKIYTPLGQLLYNEAIKKQHSTLSIDFERFPKGIYVIEIHNASQREFKRVSIQ